MRVSNWPLARWIAAAALAAALLWDLSALLKLVREPVIAPLSSQAEVPAVALTRRPLDDARIHTLAASHSPFGAPSGASAAAPFTVIPPTPIERPRLTGTVVQGDSGFAVIELADGTMRLVHRGESAAGFTLRVIAPGIATFTDSTGHRIVLHAATPETAIKP